MLIVLSIIAGMVSAAYAQDAASKKPFQRWSKEEAERVLNSQPWAVTQEVRIKYAGQVRPVAGGPQEVLGAESSATYTRNQQNTINSAGAEAPVDFQFTLRLRSSLPVREALLRLRQLEAKYDQMSEQERAAFDSKNKGLLECPACADNYVVTLSSKSKNRPGADAVFQIFGGAKQADLERYIFLLNDRGERRPLVHFVPPRVPGSETTFFFSRLDDKGQPLLTPQSKELIINLTDNQVNNITNFRLDVSKFVVNGKVEF